MHMHMHMCAFLSVLNPYRVPIAREAADPCAGSVQLRAAEDVATAGAGQIETSSSGSDDHRRLIRYLHLDRSPTGCATGAVQHEHEAAARKGSSLDGQASIQA